MTTKLLTMVLCCTLIAGISGEGQEQTNTPVASKPNSTNRDLSQLLASVFARWDSNHDGRLTSPELIAVMENPQTTTGESAAAMVVQHSMDPKHEDNPAKSLTLAEVRAFGSLPESEKSFKRICAHMGSLNRELFLPDEPNIAEIHQGPVGDCYLLSPIAALVNCNPQAVRSMIRPSGDGYDVVFGNGTTIHVPPLTDADLAVPGLRRPSGHGAWLSVLQKAYSVIKGAQARARHGSTFTDDMTEGDILGGGGPGGVITLFTGHQNRSFDPRPQAGESIAQASARVADLLTRLTTEKRVMVLSAGQGLVKPADIPHSGHVQALLGYDPVNRMVHVFNPWGNNATPAGPPGLVCGYVVRDGHYDVPIEEFVRIFNVVGYESDQPPMPTSVKPLRAGKRRK